MSGPGRHCRRVFIASAAMILSVGGLVVLEKPASAAISAPTAVGVGAAGDARVWEAAGTEPGSYVRARTYRLGVSGPYVDAQRWQWERVASSATAEFTFRIRNVASGRCLDRATAGLTISNCGTANHSGGGPRLTTRMAAGVW